MRGRATSVVRRLPSAVVPALVAPVSGVTVSRYRLPFSHYARSCRLPPASKLNYRLMSRQAAYLRRGNMPRRRNREPRGGVALPPVDDRAEGGRDLFRMRALRPDRLELYAAE